MTQAMHLRRGWFLHALCLCVIFWPLALENSCFSVPKSKARTNQTKGPKTPRLGKGQVPLSIQRERSGEAHRTKVTETGYFYKLSRPEGILLKDLASAVERRDWPCIQSKLRHYNGTAEPIYTAGINGALRCGKYREGALIYDRCKQSFQITHTPLFSAALKVFGKCNEPERVREVWQDVLEQGDGGLDPMLAMARMSAARDEGDINATAEVMDQMIARNVSIDVLHLNCAISCCVGQGKNQHNAGKYFFDLMPEFGIEPTSITFTTLMQTYTTAPLRNVLSAYEELKLLNIKPNKVFAEVYLIAVFQGLRMSGAPENIAELLRDMPEERLKAASEALNDFEDMAVELTLLCRRIRKALRLLSF